MGRIASPSLIAQAAAPSLGAILMQRYGVGVTLGTLFAASAVNVAVVITLFGLLNRQRAKAPHQATASSGAN
jgi:hypothetical protein